MAAPADFDRPAGLRFGEHQGWCDLQDVAADVVDNRSQLPRTVDHLRGQQGITLPGVRVDEFQPDRRPAPSTLPNVTMSGTTPSWSKACRVPGLPRPIVTSSQG
jgi:hypothetical protein